jgi:hypothetical protein
MSTPAPHPRRQYSPDTTAPARCHYASDPARRPHCTLTAEVLLGPTPLCGTCARARSTLGKGTTPRPLPPGPALDILGWIADADAATRQAQRTLAAAVTRARSQGHSWAQIGDQLGVTRQAAHQRFGHDPPREA